MLAGGLRGDVSGGERPGRGAEPLDPDQRRRSKAIAYNVCGADTSAKLSKADWKPYALTQKMLQIEHKLTKENAERNGWNVTEETTAVTEQFCAAVKTR